MELITSGETLDFLSKSAPRAWIKRMLLWMIYTYEIDVYCLNARSVAKTRVYKLLLDALDRDANGPKREEQIREHFSEEMAEKLLAANEMDELKEVVCELTEEDTLQQVSCGYFVYATHINWEEGVLLAEIYDSTADKDLFLDSDELLQSEFDDADYEVGFTGLCFDREKIEMLQPNFPMLQPAKESREERPRLGRPRTWDWESTTAYLLSIAQTPDGLPTGPGAQAQIERLVADWFMASTGNTPAVSQIRQHVAKITKALKKPES